MRYKKNSQVSLSHTHTSLIVVPVFQELEVISENLAVRYD